MPDRIRALLGWGITLGLAAVVVAGLVMGDTRSEDRVDAIGKSIKCPVCQGEAIAASPSETAQAMMEIVEEKVAAGESDRQIYEYFQARYGEGILLDPPFSGKTLVVWLLPAAAVAGGIWMIATRRRSPASRTGSAP